jgi:putative nucleotidyltransferase with HDIG domain
MIDREEGTATLESDPASRTVSAPEANNRNAESDQNRHHVEQETPATTRPKTDWRSAIMDKFTEVNKELWLILSLLLIAGAMNYLVTAKRMILGFYTMPTLFSAYFYGRRHAVLTAFASACLVGLLVYINPSMFSDTMAPAGSTYDILVWGGILVVTAYAMGSLYERQKARLEELRQTYHGLLLILRQFVSKDKYTENHCYRTSVYASKIAAYLGFSKDRTEDVRAASLLHDIGKMETSRELLYKAARLTQDEFEGIKKHVDRGATILEPIGGPLHRIIPIILAHHEKMDGSGYHHVLGGDIPLEARVISVADVYDSLTSDRPYRKAMSPYEAKETVVNGRGTDFDPAVVDAFLQAFRKGEMEVPELVL